MDTGREWTRRSIEELIEARLKRLKISGGSENIYMSEDAQFAPAASYNWGFTDGRVVYNWAEDTGIVFPGRFGDMSADTELPVISNETYGTTRFYMFEMPCDITDAVIDNGFTDSPFYIDAHGYSIKYAWAYDHRTNELFRINYSGEYLLPNTPAHILQLTDVYSHNITILGQTVTHEYAKTLPYSRTGFKNMRDKVVNFRDNVMRILYTTCGVQLDDDSIKSYIKYRTQGLTDIVSVSDLDLDQY